MGTKSLEVRIGARGYSFTRPNHSGETACDYDLPLLAPRAEVTKIERDSGQNQGLFRIPLTG